MASGPSLTQLQADAVAVLKHMGLCRIVVVNDNWRIVPTADVLYAADGHWWNRYLSQIVRNFPGELWTQDPNIKYQELHYVKGRGLPGLSKDPSLIHTGFNSGYQAINLAYHFGARQIVLVGFDMMTASDRSHWFGEHPEDFKRGCNPSDWVVHFDRLATDLEREGVDVVNCTTTTALKCFRRSTLHEEFVQLEGVVPKWSTDSHQ